MHRLVALLLLLTLPLQALWGAAEPYYQHEQGHAAQHFGHHVHDHAASLDVADAAAGASAQADHGHHCCSAWSIVQAPLALPRLAAPSPVGLDVAQAVPSVDPDPIDRPNWLASL